MSIYETKPQWVHSLSESERDRSENVMRSIDQLTELSRYRVIPMRYYFSKRVEDVQTFATRRYDASDMTEFFDVVDSYSSFNKPESYVTRSYAVRILDDESGEKLVAATEASGITVRSRQGAEWQGVYGGERNEVIDELEHRISDALSRIAMRSELERIDADIDATLQLRTSQRFASQFMPDVDRGIDQMQRRRQKLARRAVVAVGS